MVFTCFVVPVHASFVYGIAKRSRKYYLALTTATQDVQDFLSTDYGKAILSNSSIQMLLKQSPTEIDLISKVFYLSEGEKELLLSADIGEGLFFAGQSHVAIKVIAAPFEHTLITSNPQEILKQREQEEGEKETPQQPSPYGTNTQESQGSTATPPSTTEITNNGAQITTPTPTAPTVNSSQPTVTQNAIPNKNA